MKSWETPAGAERALVPHSTAVELVAAFQDAERTVRESFAAIVEAQKRINATFALGGTRSIWICASTSNRHDSDFEDADAAIKRMERQAWHVIADRLELRRLLSIERYRQLEEHLERGELPSITEANVGNFVQRWIDGMTEMHEEAVREVFDWLRPRENTPRAGYKRNGQVVIGKQVILEYAVERSMGRWIMRTTWMSQRIQALENVLRLLDGKGYISKQNRSELESAIALCDGAGETDLFRFRCYRNGNLHLTFRRLDLLDRLNKKAGGMNLKPKEEAA